MVGQYLIAINVIKSWHTICHVHYTLNLLLYKSHHIVYLITDLSVLDAFQIKKLQNLFDGRKEL